MDNPLSKLAIDYWYHALMVVGIVVFLLAGAGLLKAYPLVPASLISLGTFFIGLGEWMNHPLQTKIHPIGIIRGHPRNTTLGGIAFDIVGIVLIGLGGYKFFA